MNYFYLVPAASVVALLFALYFFKQMMRESEGTEKMVAIARYVRSFGPIAPFGAPGMPPREEF